MNNQTINAFSDEYRRYRLLAEGAIEQLTDEQILKLFGDCSIAMYINHLGGNLRSRFQDFLTTDGEKENRNRDGEFELGNLSIENCHSVWKEGWTTLQNTLVILNDSDLEKIVTIRKQKLNVSSALTRSVAHAAYHVGQIVLLAKVQLGENWKSLSIPRGESAAYNLNPNLEVRK